MKKFINVDGKFGRGIIPFAHNPHYNPEVIKYDKMSFADRFREIGDDLTVTERTMLETFLTITSGGTMENSSFFEMLRWWALGNYDYREFLDLCLVFKLRCGQSGLARKIFDEAVSTGRLSYEFSTPISAVADEGSKVHVTARGGDRIFTARHTISTIPLNVLHNISWSPPLLLKKREASRLGHVNQVSKVHVEVANPALRTFSGFQETGSLTYCFGDGMTPAGNTHLVAFGSSIEGRHLQPEDNAEATVEAWRKFAPREFGDNIKRVVFHNWHRDEFSRGAWEWLRPGMATTFLDDLRKRQGRILFGSADWAMGWRGFIDGAIEDGARVAMDLVTELRETQEAKYSLDALFLPRL